MSKIAVAGAVVIVVGAVGGGGYYYTSQQVHKAVDAKIKEVEQSVPGLSITYANSSVDVFSKTLTMDKVVIKAPNGQVYEADQARIAEPKEDVMPKISIDKFSMKANDSNSFGFGHGDVENLKVPAGAIVFQNGKIVSLDVSKINFDLLNIADFSFQASDGTKGGFAQYQLKDFGVDRQSDQLLKQVDIAYRDHGADGTIKIGQLQVGKVDIAKAINNVYALVQKRGDMSDFMALVDKMQHQSLTTNTEGQQVTVDNIEVTNGSDGLSLGNFKVTSQVKDGGNIQANYSWTGLKVKIPTNDRDTLVLRQMGYNELELSGAIGINYAKDSKLWTFEPLEVTIKDVGKVNMSMKMVGDINNTGSSLRMFAPGYSPETDPALSQYKLASFKMTVQDQGVFNRGLKWAAQQNNQDADQMKQLLIDQLENTANNTPNPVAKQFYQAGVDFMKNPTKTLTMTINPKSPVSVDDLRTMSPDTIADQLNISFETGN